MFYGEKKSGQQFVTRLIFGSPDHPIRQKILSGQKFSFFLRLFPFLFPSRNELPGGAR